VVAAFLGGQRTGHSAVFHIEDAVLLAERSAPIAMRVDEASTGILVRVDLPEAFDGARRIVEDTLAAEGLTNLDQDTLFAGPVAIQVLGLRLSSWDLWGRSIDDAFAALRGAAAGDDLPSVAGEPPGPFAAPGADSPG